MSRIIRNLSQKVSRFNLPIKRLENDSVCLVPFDVDVHASFFNDSVSDPGMYEHFASGPYTSLGSFVDSVFLQRSYVREDMLTYAIYERGFATDAPATSLENGEVAGMISLVNVDTDNRSAEVGILQILPSHRSRGIATKAGSLLAWHGLQPASKGGMGLVRMEWHVAVGNKASEKVARNLGFKEVGLIKYERLLKDGVARGKVGNNRPSPPDTLNGDLWRDVVIYAQSWDEWSADTEYTGYRASDVTFENDSIS